MEGTSDLIMNPQMWELGGLGLVFMLLWRISGIFQYKITGKIGQTRDGQMTEMQCMIDPTHFARIKEMSFDVKKIKQYTDSNIEVMEQVRKGVQGEKFGCVWDGRDEVRDLMDLLKEQTRAVRENTAATNRLVDTLKKNGQ